MATDHDATRGVWPRLAGADGRVRYAALGDSSTEGMCDPDGHGGWVGWSQRLARRMAEVHGEIDWANLAVRGRTAREVLVGQLAPAVALAPSVVTVVAGMNDLLRVGRPVARILEDLGVVHHTLSATGATVVTVTLPDLAEVVAMARPLRGRVAALNDGIRAFADDGVVVVDLAASAVATDPRLWAEDRLHANALGHERIAEGLAAGLGLPSTTWDTPFDSPPTPDDVGDHAAWRRTHLAPWLGRRLRGVSSGRDLGPRHPDWTTVSATSSPTGTATAGAWGSVGGADDTVERTESQVR